MCRRTEEARYKQVSENIVKNLECENSVFEAKIEFSHSIKVHQIN